MPETPDVPVTARERHLIAKLAAYESWAKTENRPARTAPARKSFNARFEREVDPANELSPAERAERADAARKAYFARLALKSAQARRWRKAAGAADRLAELGGGDAA